MDVKQLITYHEDAALEIFSKGFDSGFIDGVKHGFVAGVLIGCGLVGATVVIAKMFF